MTLSSSLEVDARSLSPSPSSSQDGADDNTISPASGLFASSRHAPAKPWARIKKNYKILLGGQVLSFLLAVSGAAQATLHFNCDLSAPMFTVGIIYVVLSFHLIVVYFRSKREYQYHQQASLTGVSQDEAAWTIDDDDDDVYNNIQDETILESPHQLHNNELTKNPPHTSANQGLYHAQTYPFLGLRIHRPVWQYMIIALLDSLANYCTVLAFRYTTLTSITLFDSLAIPSAMLISKFILGRQYSKTHLFGVMSCMVGILFNVYQDYEDDITKDTTSNDDNAYPHKFRGDMLAILGGCLYGLNDVITESSVRAMGDGIEYLGMVGLFAAIFSLALAAILERQDILAFFNHSSTEESECSTGMAWSMFGIFVGVSVAGYAGATRFLQASEATFFNLSLLTGDMWSVLFSVIAEHIVPRPLFFVALAFVMSGVIIYETAPSPVVEDRIGGDEEDENEND
jgi:solute carrier family 35, member F1/2